MRRGFLNHVKKQTAQLEAKVPPVVTRQISVNAKDSTFELAKRSNFDVSQLGASLSAYATLMKSPRLVLHKIHINGAESNFRTAAALDSRTIPLLPTSFASKPISPKNVFEIRSTEGRGLGMFALNDIPAGGLILNEHPSVISPAMLNPDD